MTDKTLEQRAFDAAESMLQEVANPLRYVLSPGREIHAMLQAVYLAAAKEAEQEIAALSKVVALADALAGEFERAVASRNPVSGMQVSPSGDFISCAQLPSAIKRMGWWAREIRAAGEGRRLTQTTPEVERLRARVAELEGMVPRWCGVQGLDRLRALGWHVAVANWQDKPPMWLMAPPIPLPEGE